MSDNENMENDLINDETQELMQEDPDSEMLVENITQEEISADTESLESPETLNNNTIIDANIDMPTVGETSEENLEGQEGLVTVQPVKFASFDDAEDSYGEGSKNLDNLLDIKLQLTVELGRATLPVRKVLELTRGSIVELEKVAGEPVELYANGKLIAHGEVVVIEDNFGLRITSMTDPEPKLNVLK